MLMRTTFPPPVLPSKVKKLARGASRTPNAFKMSCASIPPTTAQTGANSCIAVVTMVSTSTRGIAGNASLLTSALAMREFAIASSSSAYIGSSGRCPCRMLWNSHKARIMNTAAGFRLLVWRRGTPDHRCFKASRSGLYETVTLTSFPSCLPPERSEVIYSCSSKSQKM